MLVETIWTPKGKKYKQNTEQINAVITAIFEEANIVMQDDELVSWSFISSFLGLVLV